MPATPVFALPYPAATDPADVPTDMGELATAVETALGLMQRRAELAYSEFTAPVAVTVVAESAAIPVVTTPSVACDGTPVVIEFVAPIMVLAATAAAVLTVNLWVDGADQGRIAQINNNSSGNLGLQIAGRRRLTPAAGNHTFAIRAWSQGGTTTIYAGTGGAGAYVPGSIRVARA